MVVTQENFRYPGSIAAPCNDPNLSVSPKFASPALQALSHRIYLSRRQLESRCARDSLSA